MAPFDLTRSQILAHRRRAGMLDERRPFGPAALEAAAWAGLQDSMPRAAVLSAHARVAGCGPLVWDDPVYLQVWGPRFSVYVIARRDLAVFTLGRLPDEPTALKRAREMAAMAQDFLGDKKMTLSEAGHALGMDHNMFRYAAPTGTLLVRWEGAGKPLIWTCPAPDMDPFEARVELARRHLHVMGPSTPQAFGAWAGIKPRRAVAAYESLAAELTPARTPLGDRWVLTSDVDSFATKEGAAATRLLPSGDAYWLLHGPDRELLVPDGDQRRALWTPRVWPGAMLVNGELAGTWRRANHRMTMSPWRKLDKAEEEAIEAEAAAMPLPDLRSDVIVSWS